MTADDSDSVSALERAQWYSHRWQTTVCYAETYGARGKEQGTAFISVAYGVSMLVTARHMLEKQDSIRVTVVTYRGVGEYEPVSFTKPIYPDSKRGFMVPDTLKDIAVMGLTATEPDPARLSDGFRHYVIPRSTYLSLSDLFVGLPVVICGYPLSAVTGPMLPLVRRGYIAGIDEDSKTILLDAQIFPGSSGSAVFLDLTNPAAIELNEKTSRWFVGLVYGYKSMRKAYINPRDPRDRMTMSENSGIGLVVPADVLAGIMDAFEPSRSEP